MKTILVTGGAGFFGGIVKRHILEQGYRCISVDLVKDEDECPNLVKHQLDICDAAKLRSVFADGPGSMEWFTARPCSHTREAMRNSCGPAMSTGPGM